MRDTLDEILPWGRSYDEYVDMFALTPAELGLPILGCADGPSAFNSEMYRRGGRVISCDPIYRFSGSQLRSRIDAAYDTIIPQTRENRHHYVWNRIRSVKKLGQVRMAAMELFLSDYEEGRGQGRYVPAGLPALPFADQAFELALCSHFLFLYSVQLTLNFHVASLNELCRVAREVRVFPLLDTEGKRSCHVNAVTQALDMEGAAVEIWNVPYEFQRGGNKMMRIRAEAYAA